MVSLIFRGFFMKKRLIHVVVVFTSIMTLRPHYISVHAESIAHLTISNHIYSVTVSNNLERPFNVYKDGEFVGEFPKETVLESGFKEDTLADLLKEHQASLIQKEDLPISSNHSDIASPNGENEITFGSVGTSYHNDLLYPSDAFQNVGSLSVFENYNGDKTEFERLLADYAYIARSKGLLPSVMIGQAMLESGDDGGSGLALGNKNLFGIKGEYNGNGTNWNTLEDYGGLVQVNDQFRLYPTYKESVMDYVRLITETERYTSVVSYNSPEAQITAIKNAGYATDSNYIGKVLNIINEYNLTRYDF